MNWYKIAKQYIGYHGSPAEFENFSYDFLGSTATAEGFGFYFTSDQDVARMYAEGEPLKKAILDIKKPLNHEGMTISPQDFAVFLKVLDPKGDGYLSNWGDVNYDGYENILNLAISKEMETVDNDVDLVSSIIQAEGRNAERVNEILRQSLGYDGIVIKNPSWGLGPQEIYIVFNNDQIRFIQ
jgi:hypothetical protein